MNGILIAFLSALCMLFSFFIPHRTLEEHFVETSSEEATEPTEPTGEPGAYEPMIYWNGRLYRITKEFFRDLPDDAYKIGEIVKEDKYKIPKKDLEATCLDVGTEVYADESGLSLYVIVGEIKGIPNYWQYCAYDSETQKFIYDVE